MNIIIAAFVSIILFLGTVSLLFYRILKASRHTYEENIQQQHETMTESAIRQMEYHIEEMREVNHNTRHHLAVIASLIDRRETEEAKRYLAEVNETFAKAKKDLIPDNPYVNTILFRYIGIAEKDGIRFDYHVPYTVLPDIPHADLCAVLSNILENAFRAVRELPDPDARTVSLTIEAHGSALYLCCQNAYLPSPRKNIFDIKPDGVHGYGLRSVEKTAKRYGGTSAIRAENGTFTIEINMSGR